MKLSFDYLLKSLLIIILTVLAIVGIVVGSVEIGSIQPQGRFYDGDVSTTIYFSPYKQVKQNSQNNSSWQASLNETLDFSKPRNQENTQLISNESWTTLANQYSNKLHALGFSEINVSYVDNAELPENLKVDASWLNDNQKLPALQISTNRTIKQNPNERDRFYRQRLFRNIQTTLNNQYNLSLETTDGYVVLDNADFIKNSIQVTRPSASSPSSALTIEVKLKNNENFIQATDNNQNNSTDNNQTNNTENQNNPTPNNEQNQPSTNNETTNSTQNQDGANNSENKEETTDKPSENNQTPPRTNNNNNQQLKYFDSIIPENSDYKKSNGQGSVEGSTNPLFATNNTADTLGNRNLVLWNDKVGALNYVRQIFKVTWNSNEWFSLNDQEKSLWSFLHGRDGFEANVNNKNLVTPFRSANDIQLNHLYYIYAQPKAYKAAPTDSKQTKPEEITTPEATRESRSSKTDFSGLFSHFILYEVRTTDTSGNQTEQLTNLFPTNVTINHNGNGTLRLTKRLTIGNKYEDLTFNDANSLETLIKQNDEQQRFVIVGETSKLNDPLINKTFTNFNQYQSGFLAVGIILLLISLLLIISFKIQGLFGVFGFLLSSILTFFIYSKFNGFVDLFSITGWIGVIIFNFLVQAFINLHFRRNVSNKISLLESWKNTHNQTFLKAVDVHLIILVIGLFMSYLSSYESQSIGILLIVSSLIGFLFNYGLTVLLVKIFNAINNFSPKLYLYKKTYINLNKISGNLSKDAMEFNDLVSSIDEQVEKTFSKQYKYEVMNKKSLAALFLFIGLIILGAFGLYQAYNSRTLFNNTDNLYGSLNTILISLGSTSLIGLVYFLLRYQWIVVIGYVVHVIISFSIILGTLLLTKNWISNNFGYIFLLISLFSYIYAMANFVFGVTNLYTYFNLKEIYKTKSVKTIVNNTTVANWDFYLYSTLVATIAYFIFYGLNYGGNGQNLNDQFNPTLAYLGVFSLINIILINIASIFLLNPLIGLLMIQKSKTNAIYWSKVSIKTKKEEKNLDLIDEQLVQDINFFKKANKVVYHDQDEQTNN
ncbi:hypothetical protein [Mycoplasma sp. E35C]|uniref:hypothetical protein n=1 Tax=Mycoplasma sp. E35C TaxID=2801918 RepID=UPI001CA4474D|nr:hypothetical protein [Mycoplasma sp. E35C]QZX49300.1 hypothetical protein JJE79_00890 [Mycoplasma sp. E35C]